MTLGVLVLPAGPGCGSSGRRTDSLGPGHFVEVAGNFGVCSEAETSLYHFNISHCYYASVIALSRTLSLCAERLESLGGLVTGPKVM